MNDTTTHTETEHDVGDGGTEKRRKLVKQPDGSIYDPETGELQEPPRRKPRAIKVIPESETKRARFVRLVNPRMERALHGIAILGAMGGTNRHRYEYGAADVDRIASTLTEAVADLVKKLQRPARQMKLPFDIEQKPS